MENQDLPVDALFEIALQTADPIDVLNQCKADAELASRFDEYGWKTWMQRHNPELYIIIDNTNGVVYDQLFFTPKALYKKLYKYKLTQSIEQEHILLRTEKREKEERVSNLNSIHLFIHLESMFKK